MDSFNNFYTDHPFVDWYKTTQDEELSQKFFKKFFLQNGSVFGLDDIVNFQNTASHKFLVQNSKSLWMSTSELTEHSFLVLIQKWHKLCFENSGCKFLSFYKSTNSSLAGHVCGLLKFLLCMVCRSNFSWIKVQNASEIVFEAFNFSLKLLDVLSKQLA